jgi:hypothetical protein
MLWNLRTLLPLLDFKKFQVVSNVADIVILLLLIYIILTNLQVFRMSEQDYNMYQEGLSLLH